MPDDKWRCECGFLVFASELLTAPNPFDVEDTLHGCPLCKRVNALERACDEPGCGNLSCAGTPHPGGYKFHCHLHPPKDGV